MWNQIQTVEAEGFGSIFFFTYIKFCAIIYNVENK